MDMWEKRFNDMMDEIHGKDAKSDQEKTTYTYEVPPKKEKKTRFLDLKITRLGFVLLLILCVLVSGAAGAFVSMELIKNNPIDNNKTIINNHFDLKEATGSELTIQQIAALNADSVVAITTEYLTTSGWIGQYVSQGAGSGLIYSEDGYVITNHHVIQGARKITVTLNSGEQVPATLIASDSLVDVAVIKIDKKGLKPVTFSDMKSVAQGDLAVAIGNPLGTLAGTVTEGIISALEREISVEGTPMTLLQTSAAISPGNSGGGLFDHYGHLIGMVVAKTSGNSAEGLGFAIPADKVKEAAENLVSKGYVPGRAALGITVLDLTNTQKALYYGVRIPGIYVQEVTGKSAKESGLMSGDMIYKFDGTQIASLTDLSGLLSKHAPGDTVTLTIVRNSEIESMLSINIVLMDAGELDN